MGPEPYPDGFLHENVILLRERALGSGRVAGKKQYPGFFPLSVPKISPCSPAGCAIKGNLMPDVPTPVRHTPFGETVSPVDIWGCFLRSLACPQSGKAHNSCVADSRSLRWNEESAGQEGTADPGNPGIHSYILKSPPKKFCIFFRGIQHLSDTVNADILVQRFANPESTGYRTKLFLSPYRWSWWIGRIFFK